MPLYARLHPSHRCTHCPSCWTAFSAYREGTAKPGKLPALCRQCKCEGPLNITIMLNRESERSSADLNTTRAAAHSFRAGGRETHPAKHLWMQLQPHVQSTDPFLLFSPSINSTLGSVPLLPSLLSYSPPSYPPPHCIWNEAPGAPISELALSLWAVKTDNAWLCNCSLQLHYPHHGQKF